MEETWKEKIIVDHPKVKGYLQLFKEIIKNADETQEVYQKLDNSRKILIQKRVPHFIPFNNFIRISMEMKPENNVAFVTSIYPVNDLPKEGVKLL